MKFKRSLQFRIFISYAIFGIVIGIILFLFLFLSYNQLEDKLVLDHLEDEMEFFIKLVENNPTTYTLKTKKLSGYRLFQGEKINDFPFLVNWDTGIRETDYNNRNYVINIVDLNQHRYYIIYDITDFENQEHQLTLIFSGCILLAVVGSIWYGYNFGDRVLAPVKHLTDRLKMISGDNLDIRLGQEFANDEVGSLANSFDTFIERIQTFVDREKNFVRSEEHTSELQSRLHLVCRLLLEKKKKQTTESYTAYDSDNSKL